MLRCSVLLVTVVWGTAVAQLFEGDPCPLPLPGSPQGRCTPIEGCPWAQEAIKGGATPSICVYQGFVPIVCCLISVPANVSKAEQMCGNYSAYVWTHMPSPVLLPGASDIRVDLCFGPSQPQVIGGEDAKVAEFPHMALVGYGERTDIKWLCGGSLISPNYVLTAAHCMRSPTRGPARWVLVGTNVRSQQNTNSSQLAEVSARTPHPEYRPPAHYNDIALLRLDRELVMGKHVRPACLHRSRDIGQSSLVASGWGLTFWADAEGSDRLQKVSLPVQSTQTCDAAYRSLATTNKLRQGIADDTMVCAGAVEGKDTCKGDSGGPLQYRRTDPYCMYDVVGVTSFGKTVCGSKQSPGVYTRVSAFVPWIESIVWE